MRYLTGLVAVGLLGIAGAASGGDFSATVTAASDYDFRGITLTAQDPTLQASIDYAHDSGFYAGIWGSNIDFGNCCSEDIEIDYYVGYGWGSEDGPAWNAFFVYYTDPGADFLGTSLDYWEANFGVTYKWLGAKLWYTGDYNSTGADGYYVDLSGTFSLPNDFGLVVHGGYSAGQYWSSIDSEYFDYSIGVTKSLGHFNLALKFIDGSDFEALNNTPGDILSTDNKVVLSVATTFPWGD